MSTLKNSFEFGYLYAQFLPILQNKDNFTDAENIMLDKFVLIGNALGLDWHSKDDITYQEIADRSFHIKLNHLLSISKNESSYDSWMLGQLIAYLELTKKSQHQDNEEVKSAITQYQKGISEFSHKLKISNIETKTFEDLKDEIKKMDTEKTIKNYNIGKIDTTTGNVHLGDNVNSYNGDINSIDITIKELQEKIEGSDLPEDEKTKILAKINDILSHPLVTSIVGGIV